jgi:hypothetical protein
MTHRAERIAKVKLPKPKTFFLKVRCLCRIWPSSFWSRTNTGAIEALFERVGSTNLERGSAVNSSITRRESRQGGVF